MDIKISIVLKDKTYGFSDLLDDRKLNDQTKQEIIELIKEDIGYVFDQQIEVEAINYTYCCKSDSELLRDEKEPTTWGAFLAGYKKRAEMSGLKYDEVSELHAKTLYKCWKSFDLNP